MKVIVVSNMYPNEKNPSYGVFVKNFCEQLDKKNINYIKCVMFKTNSKISKFFSYSKFYINTIIKLLFEKYDIVYVHYASHSSIPVLIANSIKKKKIYVNLHGSDVVPENNVQEKFQVYTKKILKKSCKVIVPSDYFKDYVSKKYNINKSNIYVYPSSGINTKTFHKKDDTEIKYLREKWGISNKYPVFGMVGRISEGKGWDTFLKSIRYIVEEEKVINFLIVGDGPQKKDFINYISKYNLDNKINFVHRLVSQNELCEIYNVINYLVFPTKREGESLGLVAIEAMACGTPVIASDLAAPSYYIKNDINGYLFNPNDYRELSFYINKAYYECNKEEYKNKCIEAIKTSKNYFEQNILYKLEEIFDLIKREE